MQIKLLTREDFGAHTAFREKMWPSYAVAGVRETIEEKYIRNPHVKQCPGSGFYACIRWGEIVGVLGPTRCRLPSKEAFTWGHMVVNWAVLPQYQKGGAVGVGLFRGLLALPGRKYASTGTPSSEKVMAAIGTRIPAVIAAAVLDPLPWTWSA